MFNREPNIDILFRNGLKDLEVLPPADVWDNIPPMPVKRSSYRIITGIAAGAAAVVSLALLATWYTRSNNTTVDQFPELAIVSGEQQAVRVSRTTTSPVTVPAEIRTTDDVTIATPPERAGETILSVPDNEPLHLLAQAETTSMRIKEENPVSFSPDDVTVIAAGYFSDSDNLNTEKLLPADADNAGQRFLVGASLSPAMEFSLQGQDLRLNELKNGESGRSSYTTGLTFGYKISDRLTIHSGIGLASIGQTITDIDVFAGLSDFYSVKSNYLYTVQTASGLILAGNTDLYLADSKNRVESLIQGTMDDPSKYNLTQVGSDIRQVFRYLELPLMLRYKVIDRKVGLNLSGGVAYGFLVDNMAYTGEGSDIVRIGHTEGINPHNFSSQLGLGMEYNISSNVSFNFEPVFKYYVTPLGELTGSPYKPYSLGFFSGFFFKF
jgi:opacity protein-like surface antigen